MKMEEWMNTLKECKWEQKENHPKIKLSCNKLSGVYRVDYKIRCKACKHERTGEVIFKLKEKHKITVFQAELIYKIFIENKIPFDYGAYHGSIAGKRFIKLLDKIKVDS